MNCRDCEKKMSGGFKQEDGSFLCSKCVFRHVERVIEIGVFQEICELCDSVLMFKQKRANKKILKEIRLRAKSIVAIHSSGLIQSMQKGDV